MTVKDTKAAAVLDREFLEIRCRVIDIAGAMDRIERAPDSDDALADPRMAQLRRAIGLLIDGKPDRAERAQLTFSDEYDPEWRSRPAP